MNNKFGTARPYSAVYVILRKDNKVAFLLRGNLPFMGGHYGLPQGKVEINEPFTAAAVREAKEETGIDIDSKYLKHKLTIYRNSGKQDDGSDMEWVDIYFEASEWTGEPYNAESHMHDELAWLDPKKLPENVIPYIANAFKFIEAGETYGEIIEN